MSTFTHDNKDYEVRQPTLEQQREAQRAYNRAFNDALQSGAILRAKLDDTMRQQKLWDDHKQAEYSLLQKQINDNDLKLSKGGLKRSEVPRIWQENQKYRKQLRDLISTRTELDSYTCEGQAFNARFNYQCSACVVYKDNGKPVYKNFEDYMSRSNEPLAYLVAEKLSELIFGIGEDPDANTVENKIMKKLGFMNDKGRLVNKDGHLVDSENRLVNEDGYLVNEAGELIDSEGNRIDESGNYVVESLPFLDDDGNPIVDEAKTEVVKTEELQTV